MDPKCCNIENGVLKRFFTSRTEKVDKLVIPEGVKEIADNAFEYQTVFTDLSLPASLVKINAKAFVRYAGIENITVASGNKYFTAVNNCVIDKRTNAIVLGSGNFVNIPKTTRIGAYAFAGRKFFRLTLPAGLKDIDEYAFSGCKITSNGLKFPDGLQTIGEHAFDNIAVSSNETLIIPNSVKTIGSYAFYAQYLNYEYVTIGNGVTKMGGNLFKLRMFTRSSLLSNGGTVRPAIRLERGITHIGEKAFLGCTGCNIHVPTTVTSIGDYGCGNGNANMIIYMGTKVQWGAIKKGIGFRPDRDYYSVRCSDGSVANSYHL